MREAITRFLSSLSGLRAPRTISTYEHILVGLEGFCVRRGHAQPSRSDVEAFLARPRADGEARAPASRNQALAAIRVFAAHATREDVLAVDPTDGIPFARAARRDPTYLTVFQLRRLFQIAASSARRRFRERDLALLALLTQAGLRVTELASLDLENVDLDARLLVGVVGKGGTVRSIPLAEETAKLLGGWLAARVDHADRDERAFLVGHHGRRMSIRSVERLFARWRPLLGNMHLHPHLMRHSFITNGIALGGDIVSLQHLAGHESIRSTQRYAHLVDSRRLDAVRRLAVAIPPELVPAPPPASAAQSVAEDAADVADRLPTPASPKVLDHEEPFDDAA